MPEIKSSTIKTCAYNAGRGEMTLTFKSGGRYTYLGVSQQLYDGMVKATSAGVYFAKNIKGKFKHQLEEE